MLNNSLTDSSSDSSTWRLLFVAWLVAFTSTLASLFFSEVMELVPCVLCWYQRIFMFPLAIVLLVGLMPLDKSVIRYALPLTAAGLLFTVYHVLLFYGIVPENLQPCSQGVSCADDNMVILGVVPIPVLSLLAFAVILALLIKIRKSQ